MLYFDYTMKGYEQYRSGVHTNCWTGLLHTLFMPVATMGFFMLIYSCEMFFKPKEIYSATDTRFFKNTLLLIYWIGYLFTFPIVGTFTIAYYHHLTTWVLNMSTLYMYKSSNKRKTKNQIFITSIVLLIFSVGMMEFIGHWTLENHASRLHEFFNSIYHTPVYGTMSIIYPLTNECWIY